MPRINLVIVRKDHAPALAIGERLPAVRLVAQVSLATSAGWTDHDPAVIDTEAPISLFPRAIWRHADFRAIGRVRVGGISQRRGCQIPAILAEVRCTLSDGAALIGPLVLHAYLAEADDAPALIGMLGFIERGVLHVQLSRRRAILRLP